MSLVHYQHYPFLDWAFDSKDPKDIPLKVDIKDTKEAYFVTADVPGVKSEDLKLEVHNQLLTIEAFRKVEKKEESENYSYVERHQGTLRRQFSLPEDVDYDSIKAKMENGVLEVMIPKAVAQKARRIVVEAQ